ncbi:MAG: hypothetical protein ACXQTG_06410 [Methanoculleaceae archaeon]
MACLNESGQWIILMGFAVSVAIFFLALVTSQGVLVGQTTAEGVSEFPKKEIRDLRCEVQWIAEEFPEDEMLIHDLEILSIRRDVAVVNISIGEAVTISGREYRPVYIHYRDGTTGYSEVFHHAVG